MPSNKNKQINNNDLMDKIVSLCKRRGFIFPGSEIYGGLANSWTYGPYGVALKNNIKHIWWDKFVNKREDIVGLDGPIILHPKLWEASGHLEGFNDAMVDCKTCQNRFRADHLIEEFTGKDMEGNLEGMNDVVKDIKCPNCGNKTWTSVRNFNMMFKTNMNGFAGDIYLRPETAGAIFIEFLHILDSMHMKLPFGVAQIGKAFRNEIVAGNFIFRVREFEQMEIEYFINPNEQWDVIFETFLNLQEEFALSLGAHKEDLRRYEHPKDKLSHYSRRTIDIEYNFPFGFGELFGLAHRGDFDLKKHSEYSQEKLTYFDQSTKTRFMPHVIEPTFGVERSVLVALCSAFHEEQLDNNEQRIVMKLPYKLAPVKIAIFPLLKNKPTLVEKARKVFDILRDIYICEFDDNGNIGKRYRRQDEIGTPYCVTIDFDSLEHNDITVRDRDTMRQERVSLDSLINYFQDKFNN